MAVSMTDQEKDLILAEYNTLRTEQLNHIGTKLQIVSSSLIAFGTFIGLGFNNHNALLMLLYPIIAFFLLIAYVSNSLVTQAIATYIRENIESKVGSTNLGWQTYIKVNSDLSGTTNFSGNRAILNLTEVLAIIAALPLVYAAPEPEIITLIVFDVLLCIFSIKLSFDEVVLTQSLVKTRQALIRIHIISSRPQDAQRDENKQAI